MRSILYLMAYIVGGLIACMAFFGHLADLLSIGHLSPR